MRGLPQNPGLLFHTVSTLSRGCRSAIFRADCRRAKLLSARITKLQTLRSRQSSGYAFLNRATFSAASWAKHMPSAIKVTI